jgi:CheY-like chemotaxis protein
MSRRIWQILIADDNAEDRAQIRRLLLQGSEDQLIFTEAVLGHEAIKIARQSSAPPDCMILDYFLPDMEAPTVLTALCSANGLTVCPVIVLTGAASRTLSRDVLRAGAQDFIGKDWLTSGSLVRAMENASQRWMMAGELERGAHALAQREHELRTLTDNTPAVLCRFDPAFRYVYANAAITRTTGSFPNYFIGRTLQELGMPATVYVPWQHALTGGHLEKPLRVWQDVSASNLT